MVDAWLVRGAPVKWELADLYADARCRVLASRRLAKYYDIIMSDGYADSRDHLEWVKSAKVGEIASWAQQVREDSECE